MSIPIIPYRYQARFARVVLILSVILTAVVLAWLVLGSLGGQRVWFAPAEPQTPVEPVS